jgi:imidazolonepropionase-like amidohydrolase
MTACLAALVAALAIAGASAYTPAATAIRGARLVTAAGAPIAIGTIVFRDGVIEAVGDHVRVPSGAAVIDGAGLTVYPGLIDMGSSAGLELPAVPQPAETRTIEDAQRWKRSRVFRPDLAAADHLRLDAPELGRLVEAGITTVLATPGGLVVKGQSALVNVVGPGAAPQIGKVGDEGRGLQIVRAPVALHLEFPATIPGDGYPVSMLGAIAFVRQSFLDAQHQALSAAYHRRQGGASRPPGYEPALDALQPALARRMPVAFDADLAREIRRALAVAREFGLLPVIAGGREADQVIPDLKGTDARVIFSLSFPARSPALPAGADEPLRELRARASARRAPAALERGGVLFAFSSAGLRDPRDLVRNAAQAVREGLSAERAIRALTIDAAHIAGAADRLGSLEPAKIANMIVTDGDLFDDRTRIRHVFVGGRQVTIEEPQPRGRSNAIRSAACCNPPRSAPRRPARRRQESPGGSESPSLDTAGSAGGPPP